jgi:hypothetical protein
VGAGFREICRHRQFPAALPKSPIAVAPTPKQNGGITS